MNHRIIALLGALAVATPFVFVAPASAQTASTLTAEAECAPDGSTQGIVLTMTNQQAVTVDIDFADAEGSAFGDQDIHDLIFSPSPVAAGASSTSSLSLPGTASGGLSVEVSLSFGKGGSELVTQDFEIEACAAPETTTTVVTPTTATAKAAAATAAAPAFTG